MAEKKDMARLDTLTPPNGASRYKHERTRLRDLSPSALIALAAFLLTLFGMSASALWAVYDRPTEDKVRILLREHSARIDEAIRRQDKRLDRIDSRLLRLEQFRK